MAIIIKDKRQNKDNLQNENKQSAKFDDAIDIENLKDINESLLGKVVSLSGQITNVIKIKGFQIIVLFDGSASLTIKDFQNHVLNKGDVIKVIAEVSIHQDNLEANMKKYFHINAKTEILDKINLSLNDKSKPSNTKFMIQSEIYEKLKPKFIEAATEIRKAIIEQRPIILRHHGDVDGYCAGLSLEKAILSYMNDKNSNSNKRAFFSRSSLRSPFYDYIDCVKDVAILKENIARYKLKDPLFIITDTGSSTESLMALKRLKLDGYKVIVIDHHFDTMDTDKLIDIHINPHLVKSDSSYISAGFLSNELANFISDVDLSKEFSYTALISGYGDNCYCSEMDQYISLFKDFDSSLVQRSVGIIYFESYHIRIEGPSLIDELIIPNKERIKLIVDNFYDSINEKVNLFVNASREHMQTVKHNNLIFNMVPISTINYSSIYPSNMRIVSVLHGESVDQNSDKFVLSIGHTDETISFRGSININSESLRFSVVELVIALKKDFPMAAISGGGHALAGTIKFSAILKDRIMKFVVDYIKNKF